MCEICDRGTTRTLFDSPLLAYLQHGPAETLTPPPKVLRAVSYGGELIALPQLFAGSLANAGHALNAADVCASQDKFFTQLKNSTDGFNVIAEFFGRGILNNTNSSAPG